MHYEQDQMDQAYMASEATERRKYRYHVDVNVGTGVGKVIDTKGGRDTVLFEGTVHEAHAYVQDLVAHV